MATHQRSPKDLGRRDIRLAGQAVSYTLKRSYRARHLRLEVRPGIGLVVVVPKSCKLGDVPEVLRRRAGWILQKLAEVSQRRDASEVRPLETNDVVPFLGEELILAVQKTDGAKGNVKLDGNRLTVQLGPGDGDVAAVLEKWFREEAARVLKQRADELSDRLGMQYRRMVIRGQKTRWASCSTSGTLSLNWKLMMMPPSVIDYVLIHELAHLKEMNHSKRFWRLVDEHCPEWVERREWLRKHEAMIEGVFGC
jgi:predicted metal-dependent hydrolase